MSKYVGRIITDQAPAGYSVFFDGSGDNLSVADNAAFEFGSGDFTVEFWLNTTQTGYKTGVSKWQSGQFSWMIRTNDGGDGKWQFFYSTNGSGYTQIAGANIANGQWHHIAVSRSGSNIRLFTDGVLNATNTSNPTIYDGTAAVVVGSDQGTNDFLGYISNLRIVKGTALYTAAFTPPTQLLNVTNTSLLTCNSPAIVDQSSNAFAITTNGNAAVSTFTPFAAYNPAPTSSNPLTPAPGVWTLDEALQYTQQGVWPSYAVNAIEDVFSTYLYTGNGSTQTITNGVNLSGQGGMVWIKSRSAATANSLYDTARGAAVELVSNTTAAQVSQPNGLTAFNSTGFNIGAYANVNTNAATYASWTFRKQAKFFDVVTYTGNGVNRTIAHNLGSVPGCIIVKRTDTTANWPVYHRGLASAANSVYLNLTNGQVATTTVWNSTAPTSTVFSVGTSAEVNANGGTYVAYLFAHDAGGFGPTGTDSVISCGVTTTGTVTLGWEPQWMLIKRIDTSDSWRIVDILRNFNTGKFSSLFPDATGIQTTDNNTPGSAEFYPNATGFFNNYLGGTWVYVAIRRGPMRPPTVGTSVYNAVTFTSTGAIPRTLTYGFPLDLWIPIGRAAATSLQGYAWPVFTRQLSNTNAIETASIAAWGGGWGDSYIDWYNNTGGVINEASYLNVNGASYVDYGFRRAPGFFDVVNYLGNGIAGTAIPHNLTITPELMIVKCRGAAGAWQVYVSALGNRSYLVLNTTAAVVTGNTDRWNSTTPTTTTFTLGNGADVNSAGTTGTYVAYLFATVPGVSKVGSYLGTGALQTINCGFTTGARFLIIKRTDSTGNWYIYDSTRGITSGNDPYSLLNTSAFEVTGTNYVDTTSVGFQVTAAAPADLNANGGNYIFLAIA